MPIDVERAMSLLRDLSEAQKHGIRKTYEPNRVCDAAVVAYDRVQDLESRLARLRELLKDASTIRRVRQVSETAMCEDLIPLADFNELRELLEK